MCVAGSVESEKMEVLHAWPMLEAWWACFVFQPWEKNCERASLAFGCV
jgi:hypothetical protein